MQPLLLVPVLVAVVQWNNVKEDGLLWPTVQGNTGHPSGRAGHTVLLVRTQEEVNGRGSVGFLLFLSLGRQPLEYFGICLPTSWEDCLSLLNPFLSQPYSCTQKYVSRVTLKVDKGE